MAEWFAFWKSDVMMKYPWAQPVFFAVLALGLSLFTWLRKPRTQNKKKSKG